MTLSEVLVEKAQSLIRSAPANTPILITPGVSMVCFVPQAQVSLAEWNHICSIAPSNVFWVNCFCSELQSLQNAELLRSKIILCSLANTDDAALKSLRAVLSAEQSWLEDWHKKFDSDGFSCDEGGDAA